LSHQNHAEREKCAEECEIDDGEQLDVAACLARVVGVVCSERNEACEG